MIVRTRKIIIVGAILFQPLYVFASSKCNASTALCMINNMSGIITALVSGVIATIISASVSLITLRANRFNDSVTKARSLYIEKFRQMATAFLVCVTDEKNLPRECDGKPVRYYYYHLSLMLNPNKPGSYWENDMIGRMTKLMNSSPHKITDKEVRDLVALLQSDLDLEWHGMMEEAKKGKLSEAEKDKLRMENYLNFKKKIK